MRRTHAVAVVWAMWAVVLVVIVITYTRLPPEKLYNVDGHGFVGGGLSRAVVYVNFPIGLAAVYLLLGHADRMSRRARRVALFAFFMWIPVFSPHVISESYLDARWGNVTPAITVAIAVVLTVMTPTTISGRLSGDGARFAVSAVLVLLALPWIAAELGFDFVGVPVLGQIFQTQELRSQPGNLELHPAVHYGDHHGLEATLLVITALVASRALGAMVGRRLRAAFGFVTGLVIAYGVLNIANDAWLEQVVKRGWTDWEIPNVLQPRLSWGWLVILAGGVALWLAFFRSRAAA